jgi:hypothetical protein
VEERKMAGAWEGEGGERLNKVEQPHGQPKKRTGRQKDPLEFEEKNNTGRREALVVEIENNNCGTGTVFRGLPVCFLQLRYYHHDSL